MRYAWIDTQCKVYPLPVAANLLKRDFTSAAPNKVWIADMTYVWTDEGWLYLAVVIDLFNREVGSSRGWRWIS